MIIIDNLCKSLNGVEVIKNVSLSIGDNEVISIVGPSGGGKSTLLRCINGLEEPDQGSIAIDGVVMNKSNASSFRRNIGMVFQQFNLFPHMTVLRNITYAPMHILGLSRTAATESARKLLRQVHMEKFASLYPSRLSGGQKQRVAIIRALALNPKIMLFDEPTSALDPEMVKEVITVIKSLVHTGICVIIVTHLMSLAQEISDRVVFFADGQVVEISPPTKFFKSPATARAREFLQRVL